MSKPKTWGHRPGGRNKQFFEGLSGLARGLDAAIENNKPAGYSPPIPVIEDKLARAAEKRARRAAKRGGDVR